MQALQRTFSTKSEPAAAAASVPGSSVSPRSNTSVKPSMTSTSTVQAVNADKLSVAGDSAEADELVRIPVATAATPVTASATSPTILVALHGNNVDLEAVAKELEQRPERLNERDGNGRTPLLAACFAKKWDVAKYFIARGADVSAKDKVF
jgi:ankyrin repeat protein